MCRRTVYVLGFVIVASACGSHAGTEDPDAQVDGDAQSGCTAGETELGACGRCGTRSRTCEGQAWGEWSACSGEHGCLPGETLSRACGVSTGACAPGTQLRECTDSCEWGPWDDCQGTDHVAPMPEACGDGIDNNCNGRVDEGCGACAAVAPGGGGVLPLSGDIVKLVPDPVRCALYALDRSGQQVVVFDTVTKTEALRIPLLFPPDDMDISADGTHLVVSHWQDYQLTVITPDAPLPTTTVTTQLDPYAIEVANGGGLIFVQEDQWVTPLWTDLAVGPAAEVFAATDLSDEPDIELSPDGRALYLGESSSSGSSLYKYEVQGAVAVRVEASTYQGGYGFPNPDRYLYLSPGGQHIYYAEHQFDASSIAFLRGFVGERIFAGDRAGTFAVGETQIFDADLLRPVAALGRTVTAAAVVSDDAEIWYHSNSDSTLEYGHIDDLLLGEPLGLRERPADPLTSYTFAELVHDPVRDRLYGLDTERQEVVVIDVVTLQPIQIIVVGSTPTALDVDATGTYLYVGHLNSYAVARIDLVTMQLDGFMVTPCEPYDLVALAGDRIAVTAWDQWSCLVLLDGPTGSVLADWPSGPSEGALARSADGTVLFVGEAGTTGSRVRRYDVSTGQLLLEDSRGGFYLPERLIAVTSDGARVFYAEHCLNGTNLAETHYELTAPIYTVALGDTLAISDTTLYDVQTGASLGSLPMQSTVQALSPDGNTLYLAAGGTIVGVDLASY